MTLREEAERLRDEIYGTAPDGIIGALNGDKWAVALMCSKSYWKFHSDLEDNSSGSMPDVMQLFAEGRDPLYIAYAVGSDISAVCATLESNGILVNPSPLSNIDYVRASIEKEIASCQPEEDFRRSELLSTYHKLPQRVVLVPELQADEIEVINKMCADGYSLIDVALSAGRSLNDVLRYYNVKEYLDASYIPKIAELWHAGRSVKFIECVTDCDYPSIELTLRELNCATGPACDSYDYNILMVNREYDARKVKGRLTDKHPKDQIVERMPPKQSEVILALKYLEKRGQLDPYRLSVMLGCSEETANTLIDMGMSQ